MDYEIFLRHAYNVGIRDIYLAELPLQKLYDLDINTTYYLYHENWPGENSTFNTLNKLLLQTVEMISMEVYINITKLVEYDEFDPNGDYYPSPKCQQKLNVRTLYDFLVTQGYL